MNKEEILNKILASLGGLDNIVSAGNCMTRLRVIVKSDELVDIESIKNIETVLSVLHDRENYYEIVVGPKNSNDYANWFNEKLKKSTKEKFDIKSFCKMIGDIFYPMIPGTLAAGICGGIATLITSLNPGYKEITVLYFIYQLLVLIQTSFLTYITAWVGYRSAEKFGATPILGGMLGLLTCLPGVGELINTLGIFEGYENIVQVNKAGVVAVILGVYLLSLLEKKLNSIIKGSIRIALVPLLTMVIFSCLYIVIILPCVSVLSTFMCRGLELIYHNDNVILNIIIGYISAALFLPLVMLGIHHSLVAFYSVQLTNFGYVTMYPALCMAGAGQVGAALAIRIKAKKINNQKLIGMIDGGLPAGILGIGEPLIYGVTLPLVKPFISAGLGAGFGGAFVMAMKCGAVSWGPSGVLGLFVMNAGPLGAIGSTLCFGGGLLISYVCGFLITMLFIKESDIDNNKLNKVMVYSPLDGKVIDLSEVQDEAFASGSLGLGVAIEPTSDTLIAPFDGTVKFVFPTKHAIGLEMNDKTEVMIHIGIDTVKLNGEGFDTFVKEGQKINKGDSLIKFDKDGITKKGYKLTTMIIFTNKEQYSNIEFISEKQTKTGEELLILNK